MGGGQSAPVHQSHFARPQARSDPVCDDCGDEHHINITNKMVERLVEDAALTGGAAAKVSAQQAPRGDYKDKIYMEKLKCLDDSHSERYGLRIDDLDATATRIQLRTANMVSAEPVCNEFKQGVIDCYAQTKRTEDFIQCWDTVSEFTRCVQDAGTSRLRERTAREAKERERRTRHVIHAREHALRDLATPTVDST